MNTPASASRPTTATYVTRNEILCRSFAEHVGHLRHAELDQIPNGYIQDYIAFGWLKSSYRGVQLTPSGDRILKR